MNRQTFIETFNELPEDVLGNDWENDLETMKELKSIEYYFVEEV